MVSWAKEVGMTVMMHTGGTSIPGSSVVTADMVIKTNPDIVSHLNGGPTAVPLEEVRRLIHETDFALEIVHCGNPKVAVEAAKMIVDAKAQSRVIIGNDAPSGTGVIPLGILRVMNLLAGLTPLTNRGIVAEGKEADLVIMDAPMGSVGDDALSAIEAGDNPAVSMVLVDGQIVVSKSRNTPPPKRKPIVQ